MKNQNPVLKRTTLQVDRRTRDLAVKCRSRLSAELQRKFASWSDWQQQLMLLGLADFEQEIAKEGRLRTNYAHSLRPQPLTVSIHPYLMQRAREVVRCTSLHPTALGTLRAPTASAVLRWALQRGVDIVCARTGDSV